MSCYEVTAEEAEQLTCRLGSGLGGGWQPALDSGLDQSMAAETTLIYPKGRPAPASLRQSAGNHRLKVCLCPDVTWPQLNNFAKHLSSWVCNFATLCSTRFSKVSYLVGTAEIDVS